MKKKIDAVKMMRQIRDELSQEYSKSPEKEVEDLKRIHEKYHLGAPVNKK
jgi:hypothetical protein